jgi:sulfate adenylyltransferase subunit 1 (EFTu-like GTPase family)
MGNLEEEIKVGKIVEYIDMIGSALIELTDGSLSVGDTIHIVGPMTNTSQSVEKMELETENVTKAKIGEKVKVVMDDKVQVGDDVYRIVLQENA